MKKYTWILPVVLLVSAFQVSPVRAEGDSRTAHRFGFYVDLLGDPYPSIAGLNLAYNIFSFLRVNGSYGIPISATSGSATISVGAIGAGAKAFVPGWNFSPTVGFNWSLLTATVTGTAASPLYGVTASGSVSIMSLTLGFDWQTNSGFYFGGGYILPLANNAGGTPYVNLGWFF